MPVSAVVAAAVEVWPSGRPVVLAVDGRSSSGKTTLASMICEATEHAVVVHTDDIAWYHAVF
jgi:uridine kinase